MQRTLEDWLDQTFSCSFGKSLRSILNQVERVKPKSKIQTAAAINAKNQSCSTNNKSRRSAKEKEAAGAKTQTIPKINANGVSRTTRHNSDHRPAKAGCETRTGLALDWAIGSLGSRILQFSELALPLFDFVHQQFFCAPAA